MGVFILLSDPIGLICGPPDRLPECASLVPIKLSRRGGSSQPRPAGPSSGDIISVLVRGALHHASSPCGTRIGPRQSSRRSPGSHQRSSTSHLQLAARSLSLTRSHSLVLGSPHLCPTLCSCFVTPVRPSQSLPGRLPSADLSGRVVAPPGAIRGVPRLCRSKQHVASASPGGTHWHPALRISAQCCLCFVTLVRPSLGLPGQLPSTGLGSRVVAPPEATRGVPRPSRSKQHVASASPGVTHRRPALLTSAQHCSCFVTLVRPRRGLPGWLLSTGLGSRVVAPPEATRGVPRPSRIKQHVASALTAPGVAHCRPALLLSAQRCTRFVTPDRPSPGPHAHRILVTRIRHHSSSIRPGGLGGQPGSALSRSYPRLREDAEFYWIPPAALRRSRQPGRRSSRSSQGSPASHPQQAARSLSLTRGHPPASGSPHLCPTLLTLRNTGPAQLGITLALGPGRLGSSCGSSSRSGGPNCQPGSEASGSHSWHPGGC
ncbi:hypothetical protein NDU88_006139 [Pleurodeles waltl]|uniref:Uncharacterized protein n=1 Tax=Pleurodeles waltl TaxID=8319 RepID=A0AAV7UK61_PLEWA|nr:hypothetical protein NDU88_006139 [Pleurodeles waltl]